MIPYSITVGNAAAPEASLSFLFWDAGLFVLPVIAIYTIAVYWFFRGKMLRGTAEHKLREEGLVGRIRQATDAEDLLT